MSVAQIKMYKGTEQIHQLTQIYLVVWYLMNYIYKFKIFYLSKNYNYYTLK